MGDLLIQKHMLPPEQTILSIALTGFSAKALSHDAVSSVDSALRVKNRTQVGLKVKLSISNES